jgi:hypothetical protein
VICDDVEFRAVYVKMKMFTRKQYTKGFSFCLGIPLFYGSERTTCIGNNMVDLAKNSTKTNRAGIDNYGGFFVGIEVRENCVAGEKMLQLIKSVLMMGCPCPGLIGFGKHTEGVGDGGIIGDKSGAVVGHTEKTANFMSGGRGTGIVDGRDFLGVWVEAISGEYIPKELDAGFVELALFGIKRKVLRA